MQAQHAIHYSVGYKLGMVMKEALQTATIQDVILVMDLQKSWGPNRDYQSPSLNNIFQQLQTDAMLVSASRALFTYKPLILARALVS
jgi:hypothetical protein